MKHTSCSTDNEGQHPVIFHWFHNTVQYSGPQTNGKICGRQRQVGREVSNRNQEAHQIGGRTKPQAHSEDVEIAHSMGLQTGGRCSPWGYSSRDSRGGGRGEK